MEQAQNVLSNAIAPVDFRKAKQLVGTVEFVAVEVLVSKIVRTVLRMENRGLMELAWVHLLSIPFMGGAAAPFGNIRATSATGGYGQAAVDGAKGIPGVLIAQWIIATASKGFHFPWFNLKDLLITAGSKALSRPLVYSVIDKLPPDAAAGFAVLDALFQNQVNKSNIRFNQAAG